VEEHHAVQLVNHTVAGLYVEGQELGSVILWIKIALLVPGDSYTGADVVAQRSGVLAVGHRGQVLSGDAREIVPTEGLVLDGVEEEEERQGARVARDDLDVIGGKLQKGFVVGGKQGPGSGGQGVGDAGAFEAAAKDGEVGIVAHDFVDGFTKGGGLRWRNGWRWRWEGHFGRCKCRICRRDTEFVNIVEKHHLIDHVNDSVAGFDVDFDDLRSVVHSVSLPLLEETLSLAHAATVLAVGHFDGFLAFQVLTIDNFILDRVEGQYVSQ